MSVDLDDWRAEHQAALEAADEFERRKNKNTPPDRWADGTVGLRKVAEGIGAYRALLAASVATNKMLFAMLEEMRAEQEKAFRAATGVFDRHGNETS